MARQEIIDRVKALNAEKARTWDAATAVVKTGAIAIQQDCAAIGHLWGFVPCSDYIFACTRTRGCVICHFTEST